MHRITVTIKVSGLDPKKSIVVADGIIINIIMIIFWKRKFIQKLWMATNLTGGEKDPVREKQAPPTLLVVVGLRFRVMVEKNWIRTQEAIILFYYYYSYFLLLDGAALKPI